MAPFALLCRLLDAGWHGSRWQRPWSRRWAGHALAAPGHAFGRPSADPGAGAGPGGRRHVHPRVPAELLAYLAAMHEAATDATGAAARSDAGRGAAERDRGRAGGAQGGHPAGRRAVARSGAALHARPRPARTRGGARSLRQRARPGRLAFPRRRGGRGRPPSGPGPCRGRGADRAALDGAGLAPRQPAAADTAAGAGAAGALRTAPPSRFPLSTTNSCIWSPMACCSTRSSKTVASCCAIWSSTLAAGPGERGRATGGKGAAGSRRQVARLGGKLQLTARCLPQSSPASEQHHARGPDAGAPHAPAAAIALRSWICWGRRGGSSRAPRPGPAPPRRARACPSSPSSC